MKNKSSNNNSNRNNSSSNITATTKIRTRREGSTTSFALLIHQIERGGGLQHKVGARWSQCLS